MAVSAASSRVSNANGRGQVANLGVPTHIKCNICKKTKPSAHNFSGRQKEALISHMRGSSGFNAAKDAYAVCTSCTSRQVVELTCFYCDKTKGLDGFSLAQRKKPDTAECWSCQQRRLNQEPDTESDSNGDSDDGNDSDGFDGFSSSPSNAGGALLTDMDNLSLSAGRNAIYTSGTSTGGSADGVGLSGASQCGGTYPIAISDGYNRTVASSQSSYGNTPAMASRASESSASSVFSSTASSNRTITIGSGPAQFNPNNYGLRGRRAPASEAGSTRSTAADSGNGNFPRVKAGPRKIVYDKAEEERQAKIEKKRAKAAAEIDEDFEFCHESDSDEDNE